MRCAARATQAERTRPPRNNVRTKPAGGHPKFVQQKSYLLAVHSNHMVQGCEPVMAIQLVKPHVDLHEHCPGRFEIGVGVALRCELVREPLNVVF